MPDTTLRFLLTAWLMTPATAAGTLNESLRATLVQMGRDDQEAIRLSAAHPEREMTEAERAEPRKLTERNQALIRQIVQEYGWPGISLAGADGAHGAWLVVQHMDGDPEFQAYCLSLMQQSFSIGDVSAHDLAYLTDRVLTSQSKPQMYGTQGSGVVSLTDEARIDRNRAAIGLEPWRVAVERRKKDYANGYGKAESK
jgi:Family of unknown function (DUF6624)